MAFLSTVLGVPQISAGRLMNFGNVLRKSNILVLTSLLALTWLSKENGYVKRNT
jgi:hypothetical protein